MKVIIESPMRGKTPEEFQRNFRYLLWCCRALYLKHYEPIASHLICPWFMDDNITKERQDGINWSWMWDAANPHWFFDDLGFSKGMIGAQSRCNHNDLHYEIYTLAHVNPDCAAAFKRGDWPPHSEGFTLMPLATPFVSELSRVTQALYGRDCVDMDVLGLNKVLHDAANRLEQIDSPERFLKIDADGHVESRPMKGTRPRGRHGEEDAALRAELGSSEKDRAENLMIVDLVRNDLGRVCATGSVRVPELMAIEEYASVFQLVSTVTGQLRDGSDVFDCIAAAFPPGSMTGAPKIAAMQLLEHLEPVRRALYSGAIGYLDARGGADLCVVIRTLFVQGERALLHAGGGVVADSDPDAEWLESLLKAQALLAALEELQGVPGGEDPR